MRYRISPLLYGVLMLLTLQPASTLRAQAPVKEFQQPNAYAVVIGISQYREEVIPKVPYAAKDAETIAKVLEIQGGIPKTHIKLLTDSKATNTDIRNHVNDWLRMRVKSDSIVYIYYAGHGTPNPQTGEVYLVPWEGHPDFPSGLYPLKDFYASLDKLPAKEIVVMLDSCFSGAPGRSVLAKGTRPMVISLENPLLAGGKIAVLSASTGNQMSSDYDKTGHGLFTHYLLAGLGGAADKDKNHLVTLKELYPYVREHVSETALDELNREQTPMLLPGEDALGSRAGQALVEVVPGFSPLITTKNPEPIQEARARPYEQPRLTGREITGKDGAPMVLVPAGEFLYGNDEQRKSLAAFYMNKYEVSTAQYAKFMAATGTKDPSYWETSVPIRNGQKPVVGMTWHDADAYCRHYGKRLPSEQEWEKAARGTDGRKYPWGNDEPNESLAKYSHGKPSWNGYAGLASIESYDAGRSPYGIHNMAGNVWEWTSSDYDSNSKVIRGGAGDDPAYGLVTAVRAYRYPAIQYFNGGFRCAMDAPK